LCVVAGHLAIRLHTVMRRGTPYQLRDVDDRPVTTEQAKAIIAERWTVPDEVCKRRRSRKLRHARRGRPPTRPKRPVHEATFPAPRSSPPDSGPANPATT
jgi:hypothetical protein